MGVADVANYNIKGHKELIKMFDQLGRETEKVGTYAVQEGAEILADDIRIRLEGNLVASKYSTGDLQSSFGIAPARLDPKTGNIDAKVGFSGVDRKGVSNKKKARIMESGSSKQMARPFFRPGVNYNRKRVQEKMEQIIYAAWDRINKE